MNARTVLYSLKFLACATLVAGCASWGGVVEDIPVAAPEAGGAATSESVLEGLSLRNTLLGDDVDSNNLPVNKYLWRASLDVLGQNLPLASVDTFSGVISTDWGSLGAANERVRVTSFVKGRELSATELDVSVFRETLTSSGVWQTASVSPSTAEGLEDAILTRARQLRIEDVDK